MGDFPVMHEEMVEKLGAKAAVQAIIDAAELFTKKSAKAFSKDNLPVPMTAGQWREEAGLNDDGADSGEEDDEDDDGDDAEGEEEEEKTPKMMTRMWTNPTFQSHQQKRR